MSQGPPLRVAIDVTPLLSFRTGIGYSVEGMWQGLSALAAGPTLLPYALGLRAPSAAPGAPPGIRSVRIPTRALLAAWSRSDLPRVDRWLGRPDVLHTTNYVTPPSRHPTVMTVNDIGFVHEPSPDPVVATFPAVIRRAVDRGAHLHVTSRQVAGEVDEAFGPGLIAAGRVHVVAYGIPSPAAADRPSHDLAELLGGRPFVLAIGSDEARKNLPRLVEAFDRAAAATDDLLLVLAGRPTSHTSVTSAAIDALAPEVRRRVVRLGAVSAATRSELLATATVLAYPSTYEGFGFPVLEAMQAGVAVVAADVAVLREVSGGAAELADPLDAGDLAAAIVRVATDDTRRAELVASGRSRAATFTWEATAEGLDRVYRRVAADR